MTDAERIKHLESRITALVGALRDLLSEIDSDGYTDHIHRRRAAARAVLAESGMDPLDPGRKD